MAKEIVLSKGDFVILSTFITNHPSSFSEYSLKKLAVELHGAKVVERNCLPSDVVCLNSEVKLMDFELGNKLDVKLVMPKDADINKKRISIFAPLSTALIGYRKGDTVEWEVPSGKKKYTILEVNNLTS